jgi:hypothetical protein
LIGSDRKTGAFADCNALEGALQSRRSLQKTNALRLLALGRVESSELCYRLNLTLDKIRKEKSKNLIPFLSCAGLNAWLDLVDARLKRTSGWFEQGFAAWAGLTNDSFDDFLADYLSLKVEATIKGERELGVTFTRDPQARAGFRLSLINRVVVGDHFILDAFDPFLVANFPGMETLPREADKSRHHRFSEVITQSLARIRTWSPHFFSIINGLVVEIVPCRPPETGVIPSGTCTLTPTAIFISCVDDVDAVAELLIHETSHIHLGIINDETALFEGISLAQAWEDEIWYSPWKDQPRSIMGILHAVHVFSRVLDYHASRFLQGDPSENFSAERLVTIYSQLKLAVTVNELEGKLTAAGREVLVSAKAKLSEHEEAARNACALGFGVLFAERHRLWTPPKLDVNGTIANHRDWYLATYMRNVH